jgi:DNA polymerase-3 subunit epsilon
MLVEEFPPKWSGIRLRPEKDHRFPKDLSFNGKENARRGLSIYVKKEIKDSHTAEADTEASMEVLLAQIERYLDMEVTDSLNKRWVRLRMMLMR